MESICRRQNKYNINDNFCLTIIFSFSHNVLKRLLSQTRQKVSLCGNRLNVLKYVLGFSGVVFTTQKSSDMTLYGGYPSYSKTRLGDLLVDRVNQRSDSLGRAV